MKEIVDRNQISNVNESTAINSSNVESSKGTPFNSQIYNEGLKDNLLLSEDAVQVDTFDYRKKHLKRVSIDGHRKRDSQKNSEALIEMKDFQLPYSEAPFVENVNLSKEEFKDYDYYGNTELLH